MLTRRIGATGTHRLRRWIGQARMEAVLSNVCDVLIPLLDAGLPLGDALLYASDMPLSKECKRYLRDARTALEQGRWMSEVWPHRLPTLYRVFLTQGRFTGSVTDALRTWQRLRQQRQSWLRATVKVCAYPTLLVLVAAGLLTFLVGTVMPTFRQLYTQLGIRPGLSGEWWFTAGHCLVIGVWALIFGGGVVGCTAGLLTRCSARVEHWLSHLHSVRMYRLGLVSVWLGSLTAGGIPIVDALAVLGQPPFPRWAQRMCRDGHDAILEGRRLSEAIPSLSDGLFTTVLATAEQTGELADGLLRASRVYETHWLQRVQRMVRVAEPVLLLLVGGLVAGAMAMLFLPMYDALTTLSKGSV
ncbi:type II secretion system F family protein [Alicyclobacillus contaminans]|uniref:type II secretion system F family protein n=1 Tax=Alicyclobacillus contaminans TaxID=392016 RepID=UPI00146FBFF2|nr:type II secretion system F family protein [Alicyclobacillus contaminans]